MKTFLCLAAMLIAAWIPLRGVADTPLQSAALAWDRGDYVAALATYLQILDSPGAESSLETIALQTGELYRTTELTTDGDVPVFSPDGRFIAYETGTGIARRTRVLDAASLTVKSELAGYGAAFSPDGSKLAYLRLAPSAALIAAQAALEAAPAAERTQRVAAVNQQIAAEAQIVVRDPVSGREAPVDTGSLRKTAIVYGARSLVFSGWAPDAATVQIYEVADGGTPVIRTTGGIDKQLQQANTAGTAVIFTQRPAGGGRGGGRAGGAGVAPATFGLLSLTDGRVTTIAGASPAFSADGTSFTYVGRDGAANTVMVAPTSDPANATAAHKGPERVDAPALSPDGARVAFQMMPNDDWEIYVANRDGTGETRVTREIEHDVLPTFLTKDRILATIGEPRHRRSYLYDLPSMTRTRLFHNNTVRTIAPEYAWVPSHDGSRVLIVLPRLRGRVPRA